MKRQVWERLMKEIFDKLTKEGKRSYSTTSNKTLKWQKLGSIVKLSKLL